MFQLLKKEKYRNYSLACVFVIIIILMLWSYHSQKTKEEFDIDWFYQRAPPTKPKIIKLKALPGSIEITWKRSETSPDAPITNHVVMVKNEDNSVADLFLNFIEKTDCEECQYIIENLDAKTNYSVSIIASNKFGDSDPAVPQSIQTLGLETPAPTPTPTPSQPVEPTIPPDNVQPKFWEDEAKELEKAKVEISKDQYDHLIESAQGVLEHKEGYPHYFPKDYLDGLEGESQKLGDLLTKSLYAGEAVVRVNK